MLSGVNIGIVFTVIQSLIGSLRLVLGFSSVLAVLILPALCFVVGVIIVRGVVCDL